MPLLPLRYGRLWLALGAVMVAVMLYVCLIPDVPGPKFEGVDKIEHVLAWLVVSAWFASLVERRGFVRLAIALVVLGVGIEFAQAFMDIGRQGDWRDVVANSLGVAGGMLSVALGGDSWLARIERWLPAT
ncbi:MAG: VanZ family protein [Steroidobacteraceae bacterium]|jgi:VanZ family protein|nr:VanZ family protein [Steroidobacteraceae bacterium]